MKAFIDLALPGSDLVEQGLADLEHNKVTDLALLVLIAGPRLERLGLRIPARDCHQPYEHQLYHRLQKRFGDDAHSQYNSLIRRIVSFSRALERQRSKA